MNISFTRTYRFSIAIFVSLVFSISARAQWHQLPGPPAGPVNDFAEIAGSNGRIYAATENGVYRSSSTPPLWHLMGLAQREVLKITQYQVADQEILLAIVHEGDFWRLCRSSDSAKTWDTIYNVQFHTILEILQDGKDIVIGVYGTNSDSASGIFRSSNLGISWTRQASGPPDTYFLADIAIGGGKIFGIVYGSGVWSLPSKGSTWSLTTYPHWHYPQSIKFIGAELFVGGYGWIDISTNNGTSWLPVPNSGLDSTRDQILSFAVNGLNIIASGYSGTFRSTDGGATWDHIVGTNGYPRDGNTSTIAFLNKEFISGDDAGVIVSADGMKWDYATDGLSGQVLDVISNDTLLFALTARGAFRSLDQGATWIAPNGPADLQDTRASGLTMLNGEIYASGSWQDIGHDGLWRWNGSVWETLTDIPVKSISGYNGNLYASLGTDGLDRSTDNGVTWINDNNGLPFDTSSTDAVVGFGSRLLAFEYPYFAGLSREQVYASDDDGLSWHFLDSLPIGHGVYSTASANGILYVATIDGLSASTDNGETWINAVQNARQFRPYGSGLIITTSDSIYSIGNENVSILSDSLTLPLVGFTHDKQFAYAATTSRGVWYAPLNNLPLDVRNAISPNTETVLEIYPNPMESNATVSFDLPDRETVSLRLFDERGVCRAILFNGPAGPGNILVPVSLSILPGIYEAQLLGNKGSSSLQIIVGSTAGH